MSKPISGQIPPGVGDKVPPEPRHPGFYTGDDPYQWAQNKIACLRHVNIGLRKNAQHDQSVDLEYKSLIRDNNSHNRRTCLCATAPRLCRLRLGRRALEPQRPVRTRHAPA